MIIMFFLVSLTILPLPSQTKTINCLSLQEQTKTDSCKQVDVLIVPHPEINVDLDTLKRYSFDLSFSSSLNNYQIKIYKGLNLIISNKINSKLHEVDFKTTIEFSNTELINKNHLEMFVELISASNEKHCYSAKLPIGFKGYNFKHNYSIKRNRYSFEASNGFEFKGKTYHNFVWMEYQE